MKKKILIILLFSMLKVEAQTSTFTDIDKLLTKGRYQVALQKLKAIQPATFASSKKIASIYESVDDTKKAIQFYKNALTLKNDYATKVKLGKIYRKVKSYKKAITIFEEIHTVDNENLLVQYQLGRLYLLTSNAEKAKDIFINLIKKDAENANYSYQLGLAYAMLKKRNLKINSFLDAYKKDDEHLKAIHQLAMAFTVLKDRDSANLFVERGLVVSPNHLPLNKMKANKLYRDKRYLDGIKLLEKVDSLKPNDVFMQKMLGRSWLKLKNYNEAKKYFNKAKLIDRQDFKTHTYLGQIALEQDNIREAFMNFSMAIFIGKEKRDQEYYGLGQVHLAKKEKKLAINMFKKAYVENRNNHKALFQIATLSQEYYEDKKIAYNYFEDYVNKFEKNDADLTNHAKDQLKIIKKYYFKKGIILD